MGNGKVKWFNKKKGFGFIIADSGEELFVHYSVILGDGFKLLEDGQDVEFDIEKDAKGLRAKNVVKK